ncbi:MAG: ABC transporter substrate-binding protein [Bacillota bacterium]
MRRLTCGWIVLLITAAVFLAGCGGKQGSSLREVPVGVVIEQTGPQAVWGLPRVEAMQVAAYQIEKAGSFDVSGTKYKLKLLIYDNRSKPDESVAFVKRLLDVDKVKILFATQTTPCTLPVLDLIRGRQVLHFTAATAHQKMLGQPGYEYSFNCYNADFGPNGTANKLVDYVLRKIPGVKKVAFLDQNNALGKMLVPIYSEACRARGLEVVAEEYYPTGTTDFYPQLSKIAALKPDLLFMGNTDEDVRPMLKQALELGFRNFATNRITPKVALERKDDIASGHFIGVEEKNFLDPQTRSLPGVQEFITDYKHLFGREPDYAMIPRAAAVYEPLYAIVEAMKKTGTVEDVPKLAAALHGMRYEGKIWTISFDGKGQILVDYFMYDVHDGQIEREHVTP